MHPQYKLEYFHHAGWEAEWIQTAEDITRTAYESRYVHVGPDVIQPDGQDGAAVAAAAQVRVLPECRIRVS